MKIDDKIIEHIADLARIEFNKNEKLIYVDQLNSILLYMEKLNELDTSDIPPTSHVIPIKNIYRDDIVTESYNIEEILANAPEIEKGFFKVPKIIE
jgi:aspartyl-tRNA(Asn)/glutamyl-tRNA(Gln) amidotransferase subunit C